MNRKLILSKFCMIVLCLTFVGVALGQTTVQVGVSQGDVFKYNVKYFWSSTTANSQPPSYLVEDNSSDYYQATIKEIIGTTVNIGTALHFPNGTETDLDELIDVSHGGGGSPLLYAANLTAGNLIYPTATYIQWVVNETVSLTYGSGARETNHFEVRTTGSGYVYSYRSIYFDKATGVLVDGYFEDVTTDHPDQTFSERIILTTSSLWTVPGGSFPINNNGGGGSNQPGGFQFPWVYGLIVAVVIVVVVAAVLLLRRRSKKTRKT